MAHGIKSSPAFRTGKGRRGRRILGCQSTPVGILEYSSRNTRVLLWKYSSTAPRVLEYFRRSTAVLSLKYWDSRLGSVSDSISTLFQDGKKERVTPIIKQIIRNLCILFVQMFIFIVKQKRFEKISSPHVRWIKNGYPHSFSVWLYPPKGQVKRHLRRAESPMERVAQGKRSGTLGMWNKNIISTPWKVGCSKSL